MSKKGEKFSKWVIKRLRVKSKLQVYSLISELKIKRHNHLWAFKVVIRASKAFLRSAKQLSAQMRSFEISGSKSKNPNNMTRLFFIRVLRKHVIAQFKMALSEN